MKTEHVPSDILDMLERQIEFLHHTMECAARKVRHEFLKDQELSECTCYLGQWKRFFKGRELLRSWGKPSIVVESRRLRDL